MSETKNNKYPKKIESGIIEIRPNLFNIRIRRRIKDTQEQRSRKNIQGEAAARKIKNQFVAELQNLYDKKMNGNITWKEACDEFFKIKVTDIGEKKLGTQRGTVEKYTNDWFDKHITQIEKDFIEYNLKSKTYELSRSTINDLLRFIRQIFSYHINTGKTPPFKNPCIGIKPWGEKVDESLDKEIPKMSEDEVAMLLHYCKQHEPDFYFIFLGAYTTGCRSGELMALTLADVKNNYEYIEVNKSYCSSTKKTKKTKNTKIRRVPLVSQLTLLIKERQLKASKDDEFVFPRIASWLNGKIACELQRIQRKLNIKETTVHSLRASFATHQARNGTSIVDLMHVLSHSEWATTKRYIREIEQEDIIKGMTDVMNKIMNKADSKKTG